MAALSPIELARLLKLLQEEHGLAVPEGGRSDSGSEMDAVVGDDLGDPGPDTASGSPRDSSTSPAAVEPLSQQDWEEQTRTTLARLARLLRMRPGLGAMAQELPTFEAICKAVAAAREQTAKSATSSDWAQFLNSKESHVPGLTFQCGDVRRPVLYSFQVMKEAARRRPPPRKWLERDKSLRESAVDFIRQTYNVRLGRGFTQADLKACDPSCYQALHQWLQRTDPETGNRNRIPPDLDLPTLEEWNARRLEQLRLFPDTIDDEERLRLAKVAIGRAARAASDK